ncbi:MAG: hypothetical protein U1E76_13250 [Planctomycetota bacterium]
MAIAALLLSLLGSGQAPPPKGKVLEQVVESYLLADEKRQGELRAQYDLELAPLKEQELEKLRAEMLKIAMSKGPKIKSSQRLNYLIDEKTHRGKYLVEGKVSRSLTIGLHDIGTGGDELESAVSALKDPAGFALFPEVADQNRYGWTDPSSEQFLVQLIEAAKRTGKVDPDHIYLAGLGMGGYGAWTLGAHHADLLAGAASFAGAPSVVARSGGDPSSIGEGVIPNLCNLPLYFFQSLDDPQTPPAANRFASRELLRWRTEHGGFEFQYVEVNGRGHGLPAAGCLQALEWLTKHARNARPKQVLWQPMLDWKKQFYWLYWHQPRREAIVSAVVREGNVIEVQNLTDPKVCSNLSLLLGPPIVDLSREVRVNVNGRERFHGLVPRTFSTILLTLPRCDPGLLFDARIDL